MKKFFIVLGLTLALVSSVDSYATAEKINREIVKSEVLKNNPLISIAKLELDKAKQEYTKASSGFFPKIKFQAHLPQNLREQEGSLSYKSFSCGVSIGLSISGLLTTHKHLKEKAVGVKIAQASYDRAVADAIYESSVKYIDLIFYYESIELLDKIKKRRVENRDIVKLKYNSGLVDIVALKVVEFDIAKVEHELKMLKRNIAVTSALLLKSMDRSDDTALLETDERLDIYCKELPQEPDYCSIIPTIPEFLIAQHKIDMLKKQIARIKVENLLPSVSFSIGGMCNNVPDFFGEQDISVDYTLFAGRKLISDIKIASNELKIASEGLKNTIGYLKGEAIKFYNDLVSAYEAIDMKIQSLDVLKLQAEVSSQKYAKGFLKYESWYNTENNCINSQKELLQAKKDFALETEKWRRFICSK